MNDERDEEGMPTYREIGRMLGMSHGTVQNIERRALAKLRAALANESAPEPPATADGRRGYRCGNCGRAGHNRATCNR